MLMSMYMVNIILHSRIWVKKKLICGFKNVQIIRVNRDLVGLYFE